MESGEVGPDTTSYRRLDIEGHAPVGTTSFIIEENRNGPELNFPGTPSRSWALRVTMGSNHSEGHAETNTLVWIFPNGWSHEQARSEMLEKLKRTIRSIYGGKGCGSSVL